MLNIRFENVSLFSAQNWALKKPIDLHLICVYLIRTTNTAFKKNPNHIDWGIFILSGTLM